MQIYTLFQLTNSFVFYLKKYRLKQFFPSQVSMSAIPENFLRKDVSVNNKRHLLFATDQQLQLLKMSKHWYLDGTFKVKSLSGRNRCINKYFPWLFNPLPHNPLTTLRKKPLQNVVEKEKMLVTSIFSFSHNIFYHSQNIFQILLFPRNTKLYYFTIHKILEKTIKVMKVDSE